MNSRKNILDIESSVGRSMIEDLDMILFEHEGPPVDVLLIVREEGDDARTFFVGNSQAAQTDMRQCIGAMLKAARANNNRLVAEAMPDERRDITAVNMHMATPRW